MVSLNVDLFLALYTKFKPEYVSAAFDADPETRARQLKLLKLAAVYHDAANRAEADHNEVGQAETFSRDMQVLGFTAEELAPFKDAVLKKDAEGDKSLFQKLIHDADSLDIQRVFTFDPTFLDILKDLKDLPELSEMLSAITENYKKIITRIYGSGDLVQGTLEHASNCYQTTKSEVENFLRVKLIVELHQRKIIDLPIDSNLETIAQVIAHPISILDVFCQKLSALLPEQELKSAAAELPVATSGSDPVLASYQQRGYLLRALRDVKEELDALTTNERILLTQNKRSEAGLREIYNDGISPEGRPPEFADFRFRPMSMILPGADQEAYQQSGFAVLINQDHALMAYAYKRNAQSSGIASGDMKFAPESGGGKSVTSFASIFQKIQELEGRRVGLTADPNLHYLGAPSLTHNEMLAHYDPRGIDGIVLLGVGPKSAQEALKARKDLGNPNLKFYLYSADNGLTALTDYQVLAWSLIRNDSNASKEDHYYVYNQIHSFSKWEAQFSENCKQAGVSYKRTDPCHEVIHVNKEIYDFEKEARVNKRVEFPVVHAEVTFTCSDPLKFQEIEDTMQMVADSANYERIFSGNPTTRANFEISRDGDTIKVKVIVEESNQHNLITICADMAFEVKRHLLAGLPVSRDILLKKFLEKLDQIKNIRMDPPSGANQSPRFVFAHPTHPHVICATYMDHGKPKLEMHNLKTQQVFTEKTSEMHKIVKTFYQQQTERLNEKCGKEPLRTMLVNSHISHLTCQLTSSAGKTGIHLLFEIKSSQAHAQDIIKALREVLGEFPDGDKTVKQHQIRNARGEEGIFVHRIQIADTQLLDKVLARLERLPRHDEFDAAFATSALALPVPLARNHDVRPAANPALAEPVTTGTTGTPARATVR